MATGEKSFLVAGGGVIGAASALRLQAAGFAVTLIDPGDMRRGASFGNAGHIGVEQVVPLASWSTLLNSPSQLFGVGGPLDFRLRDAALWGPWGAGLVEAATARFAAGQAAMEALQSRTMPGWRSLLALAKAPDILRENGHWAVWMSEREARHGLERWRRTPIGGATFRELTKADLDILARGLRKRPAGGIAFTGSGQVVEPQRARDALLQAFRERGGKIEAGSVAALVPTEGGVRASLAGRDLEAGQALIAAGAWSRPLMEALRVRTPLVGERGYSVQSAEHSWPEELPPVFFEQKWVVVTRFISGLRATSFTEVGSPDAPPDPRKWQRLEWHLRDLGIAFSRDPSRWMGPRPTLPDFVPAIGRLKSAPRVLYAFGHQHLGLTLAGVTAELIEAIAGERAPPIDLVPFRIERFA